jgi:hypothetical protein
MRHCDPSAGSAAPPSIVRATYGKPETPPGSSATKGKDVFQEIDKHLLIVFDAVAALVDAETCPEARLARLAPPLPNEVMIPDRNERWASAPRGCDLQFFVVTSALVIALGLGSFGGWSLYQYISQSDELSGRAAVSALVERIIAVESNGDPNAKNSRSSAMGSGQFLDETWLNLVRAYRPDLVRGRNARETLDLRREPKLATLKATASGIDLQQPVDGLGFEAGSLGHALGSTPCRRTQQEAGAFRGEDTQDRFDDCRLAHTWPAGHDQHLGHQGEADCGDLAFGKSKTDPLLNPRQGFIRIDPGPRQCAICQPRQALGDCAFRPIETSAKYARRFANPVGNHRPVL